MTPGMKKFILRRIAKSLIKNQMRLEGIKISYVDVKDLLKAANALMNSWSQQTKDEIISIVTYKTIK